MWSASRVHHRPCSLVGVICSIWTGITGNNWIKKWSKWSKLQEKEKSLYYLILFFWVHLDKAWCCNIMKYFSIYTWEMVLKHGAKSCFAGSISHQGRPLDQHEHAIQNHVNFVSAVYTYSRSSHWLAESKSRKINILMKNIKTISSIYINKINHEKKNIRIQEDRYGSSYSPGVDIEIGEGWWKEENWGQKWVLSKFKIMKIHKTFQGFIDSSLHWLGKSWSAVNAQMNFFPHSYDLVHWLILSKRL